MYFDPFVVGFVTGLGVGWVSLIALVLAAARWQRKGNKQ